MSQFFPKAPYFAWLIFVVGPPPPTESPRCAQPTSSTAFYANHLFCQSLLSFSSEENMPGRLHIYNTSPQT